ncbi:MAG: SlyX family protein [Gammaproteobacteria bacterium]|nr:SlyX family protein [Gammaproteobacteria bacterium]
MDAGAMVINVEEKAVADVEARLDDLESKVAFQENTIQKLNEVVIAQEARIHDLETSLRLILESLRNQAASPEIEPVENPPPHY